MPVQIFVIIRTMAGNHDDLARTEGFQAYSAVSDAPPLPKTSAFFPATSTPLACTSMEKPSASVLSPQSVPSGLRTMVLTAPMARAVSDSPAQ